MHRKQNRECWLVSIPKEMCFIFTERLLCVEFKIVLKCGTFFLGVFSYNMDV